MFLRWAWKLEESIENLEELLSYLNFANDRQFLYLEIYIKENIYFIII